MDALRSLPKRVPEAFALPPYYIQMYGDFIAKNAGAVSQIEQGLRSLTYIIPGPSHFLAYEEFKEVCVG